MNGNIGSMVPSQMERGRYLMLNKYKRSMSIESGGFSRNPLHRQSSRGNGFLPTGNLPSAGSSPRDSITGLDAATSKRTKVTINVSGEKYQTYKETLERFPKTLLGDPIKRKKFFEEEDNEYFFDRDRHAFSAVLYFYQSDGQIYCPLTIPLHILVEEIKFFELGQDALNQILDNEGPAVTELPKNRLQREIWKLFEIPGSGVAANLLTVFSVLIIICSVTILCIETLPFFKGFNPIPAVKPFGRSNFAQYPSVRQPMFNSPPLSHFMRFRNDTLPIPERLLKPPNTAAPKKRQPNPNWLKIFELCETGIVAWFTLEFVVRFLSCPNKIQFAKSCMNIIDLLAIIPYYITLIFDEHGLGLDNIRIIRLVRVFRIFKLSRHSRGLQILGLTFKASIRELGLLIFFLLIGVILFSSAIYYVEDQTFQSIPDAFWWAIITMCTVGYGDKVPDTFAGKVIGSLCAICGVLTIALPVPVIVSNFDYFYQRERARKFNRFMATDTEENGDPSPKESQGASINGGSAEYRRQEMIERQKKLKRLQNHGGLVSKRLQMLLRSRNSGRQTNNNDFKEENANRIERESVV